MGDGQECQYCRRLSCNFKSSGLCQIPRGPGFFTQLLAVADADPEGGKIGDTREVQELKKQLDEQIAYSNKLFGEAESYARLLDESRRAYANRCFELEHEKKRRKQAEARVAYLEARNGEGLILDSVVEASPENQVPCEEDSRLRLRDP